MTYTKSVTTWMQLSTHAAGDKPSRTGSSLRLLNEAHRRLMRRVVVAIGSREKSAAVKLDRRRAPRKRCLFPPHRRSCQRFWRTLRSIFTKRTGCRRWCVLGWRMFSSRPSTPTLMEMVELAGCWSDCLSSMEAAVRTVVLSDSLLQAPPGGDYRLLDEVRRSGEWEAWTSFFLEGVATIADEAVIAAREVFTLITEDRQRLVAAPGASVMGSFDEQLPVHPVVTIPSVVKILKTTKPTAGKAVQLLESLGVLLRLAANGETGPSHTRRTLRNCASGPRSKGSRRPIGNSWATY